MELFDSSHDDQSIQIVRFFITVGYQFFQAPQKMKIIVWYPEK
jgi:hypothetical protein